MSHPSNDPGSPAIDDLDARERMLLAEIAQRVAELATIQTQRAQRPLGTHSSMLIDRKNSESELRLAGGSFLEHARLGSFPSFKAGRRIVAYRADVEAWIRTRRRRARPKVGSTTIDVSADYAAAAQRETTRRSA